MKKRIYSIAAVLIALTFWFADASIHYYVYNETHFEFIPEDFNELWMRTVIILLVIILGLFADSSSRKLLEKEKQLEATRIYNSMIHASHHIFNNLFNQMQLFKMEALKSNDFDKNMVELFDESINEASDLIKRLSDVNNISGENIWASVDPGNIANSVNTTNPADK